MVVVAANTSLPESCRKYAQTGAEMGSSVVVPLKAICFLERGKENHIVAISNTEGFMPMLKAVYHSKEADREARILQSLQRIRQKTSFYRLWCNMESDAATVAYEGMKE